MAQFIFRDITPLNLKQAAMMVMNKDESTFRKEVNARLWEGAFYFSPGGEKVFTADLIKQVQREKARRARELRQVEQPQGGQSATASISSSTRSTIDSRISSSRRARRASS